MTRASGSSVQRVERHRYEFTSRWTVDRHPDLVYEILDDLGGYAEWWPQVRRSERDGEERATVHLRAALPFTLKLLMTRDVEDSETRKLRALVTGDLEGSVGWAIRAEGQGSVIDFAQVVTLTHPFVRRIEWFLRPLLRWNHAVAMAGGAAGLTRALVADAPTS